MERGSSKRERLGEHVGSLRTRSRQSHWLLATVLIVIAFSSSAASPQELGKNSNSKSASAAATKQTTSGKDLFREHCASCHFAETQAQKIGPGLKGLYARLTFSDGKRVTDASVTKWIETGGKNMPGFKDTLTPEQLRELIAYIKTL